jgi:hypothetical protein
MPPPQRRKVAWRRLCQRKFQHAIKRLLKPPLHTSKKVSDQEEVEKDAKQKARAVSGDAVLMESLAALFHFRPAATDGSPGR